MKLEELKAEAIKLKAELTALKELGEAFRDESMRRCLYESEVKIRIKLYEVNLRINHPTEEECKN